MGVKDVPQVQKLLNTWHKKFKMYPKFTEEEVDHYFLPREYV